MNDCDILIAMFTRSGVRWDKDPDYQRIDFPNAASAIQVFADGQGGANDGYFCFYTTFVFDPEGRLLVMGAWE